MAVRMNPYLVMNGNAKDAVAFYERALDGKVLGMMTFGEAPPDPNYQLPDEVKGRIMHAHMKVADTDLMFSDTFPGQEHQIGNQITLTLQTDSTEESAKLFEALAEGGTVTMPLQETFWSPAYGQLTDKFGISWQITTAGAQQQG